PRGIGRELDVLRGDFSLPRGERALEKRAVEARPALQRDVPERRARVPPPAQLRAALVRRVEEMRRNRDRPAAPRRSQRGAARGDARVSQGRGRCGGGGGGRAGPEGGWAVGGWEGGGVGWGGCRPTRPAGASDRK